MFGRRFIGWLPPLLLLLLAAGLAWIPPLRRGAVGAAAPVLGVWNAPWRSVADLVPLSARQHRRLRNLEKRVQEMRALVQAAQECREENRRLRRLLGLSAPPGWRFITAPVAARDPLSWNRRFRIGRGRRSGITPGACVLVDGAVIGRVIEAGGGTALVATLADSACRLGVRIPAAGAVGIVRGTMNGILRGIPYLWIDYLPRDRAYAGGQAVVTAGVGGFEPSALPVGVLAGPPSRPARVRIVRNLYARVLMKPRADFRWFRFVVVVVKAAPASTTP